MADNAYEGKATLEDWLRVEVFRTEEPLSEELISYFECWRIPIEKGIFSWVSSKGVDGDTVSWKEWNYGFNAIPKRDRLAFERKVKMWSKKL